jgi:hypothetical protein
LELFVSMLYFVLIFISAQLTVMAGVVSCSLRILGEEYGAKSVRYIV